VAGDIASVQAIAVDTGVRRYDGCLGRPSAWQGDIALVQAIAVDAGVRRYDEPGKASARRVA